MLSEGDEWQRLPGRLIVISGPSGSGKSTLVRRLLARTDLRLKVSISATTRAPRPLEQPGKDYFFLTRDQFEQFSGGFLETAIVHGHTYGTPAEPVRQALSDGFCVFLTIDVQGGFQVREKVPAALLIFVDPPTPETLEKRLRARGTDSEAAIQRRLADAKREMDLSVGYDVHVINDELDQAVETLAAILRQNGCGASQELS